MSTSRRQLREEALRLNDEAQRINDEGVRLNQLGQWQEALTHFKRALAIWMEIGNRHAQPAALSNIGSVYLATSQPQEALPHFEEALQICQEVGDQAWEGAMLSHVGTAYCTLGQLQQAEPYYIEALAITREVRDRPAEASTLSDMGKLYTDLGKLEEAVRSREESLVIWREMGDRVREADALHKLGELYRKLAQPQDSVRLFKQALTIWREVQKQAPEAEAFLDMGSTYSDLGQHREALRCFNAALKIYRTIKCQTGERTALISMAVNHEALGQIQERLRCLNQALTICREIGNPTLEVTLLNEIGSNLNLRGRFKESLLYYEEALVISREQGNRDGEGRTLMGMGTHYVGIGKYREALRCFEGALTIFKELGNQSGKGNALNSIGVVYYRRSQFGKALNLCNEALSIARQVEDKMLEGHILGTMGAVYDGLGQHTQSLRLLEQALQISRELGLRAMEGVNLANIGEQYHDLGQHQEALRYYENALTIVQELGHRAGEGATLNNIGEVYRELKQPRNALRYYKGALEILQEVGDRTIEASTLINMGTLYYDTQPRDALRCYETALGILQETGDLSLAGMTQGNIGSLYYQLEEYPEACQHLEEACQIFEGVRREVLTDESRTSFFAPLQYDFSNYVRALMRWYQKDKNREQAAKAFHVRERRGARALIDLIAESRGSFNHGLDAVLARERDDLLAELAQAQKRYMKPGLSEQARKVYLAQREEIDICLAQIEAKIRSTNPHYASLTQPNTLTLAQAQKQLLDGETVLLEYAREPEVSFLWAVTKDTWQVYYLPPVEEIRKLVEEFRNTLLRGSADFSEAAYNLYQLLLGSAMELIKDTGNEGEPKRFKRLIVVPDDVLYNLPFESLLTEPLKASNLTKGIPQAVPSSAESSEAREPGSKPPSYLLSQFSIIYAPSTTVLATVKREQAVASGTWEKEFIGFAPTEFRSANMLPSTVEEVKGIASQFPSNKVTLRVRGSATKQAVRALKRKQYRYIHFATHGYIDSDNPRFCGLLFPDADDDHLLHTFEIFELDLDADLVTASACKTGLGKHMQGEGMMGLMRAFLYAGTPSVCVSLWNVADESTSHLMQNFYHFFVGGDADKAEALHLAKLEMIKDSQWAHPFYWAPFVLVGDWQ
jgi:CHAT domain-containing protein/tetratricopeptide (TPR) repeat protein